MPTFEKGIHDNPTRQAWLKKIAALQKLSDATKAI